MNNPLSTTSPDEESLNLVKKSLKGNRNALEDLVKLHQPFIFNVAWKMTNEINDAKDLTQEDYLHEIGAGIAEWYDEIN